jgi:hypothetical protein
MQLTIAQIDAMFLLARRQSSWVGFFILVLDT